MKADEGRGIYKGEMIAFGGDSSKLGHQNPMITSLGLGSPSRLLGHSPLPSWQAGHPFSLVCRDMPTEVEGTWGVSPLGRWGMRDVSLPRLEGKTHSEFGVPCLEGTHMILTIPYGTAPQILDLKD